MNEYFNHIATATPGMLSSLFIWKDWIGDVKEANAHIDDAINALMALNELLINNEKEQVNSIKLCNKRMERN